MKQIAGSLTSLMSSREIFLLLLCTMNDGPAGSCPGASKTAWFWFLLCTSCEAWDNGFASILWEPCRNTFVSKKKRYS